VNRLAAAWVCVWLWACSGASGTVAVKLTTAPGSHVLDPVQQLRLTLTNPRRVVEATRSAAGFDLALELDAASVSGALIVEGFDAQGALVACGQSPGFPVAAINAQIVVYMAAPRSIGAAPVALAAPRSELAGAAIDSGVVLAGGRDTGGAPSSYLALYNTYSHTVVEGVPLPAARARLAMASGANRSVYLFGGAGPDGNPTGTLWRFDAGIAPSGAFSTVTEQVGFARTGALIVPTGVEEFLITGTPALTLVQGALAARADISLPATGAAGTRSDGVPTAIFAGAKLVRFRAGAFDQLSDTGRSDATAVTLPDGRIAILGGGPVGGGPLSRDALVVDGATGAVTVVPNALAIARAQPALAATSRYVIVAGGTDQAGVAIASAEVLDATTLASLVTLPILARSGTLAIALPNDQVLLAGGTPASSTLELFTPEPPP